jgi:hypothetical protein
MQSIAATAMSYLLRLNDSNRQMTCRSQALFPSGRAAAILAPFLKFENTHYFKCLAATAVKLWRLASVAFRN